MNNHLRRQRIAEIIFNRVAAQVAGIPLKNSAWSAVYEGWIENPALFPLVEACLDAADEIMKLPRDPQ